MTTSLARDEAAAPHSEKIQQIQETVVGMYSEHPWPLNRNADEEMGWRLKCLGVQPSDYVGKRVLDMGCGTGEYALWYAQQGAAEVVGIDLSKGSLAIARERQEESGIHNATFRETDILRCDLPDDSFDYSFSVGVLHHTGDPPQGFRHLVRVTRPGGTVVVSLYNGFSRRVLRSKQLTCRLLGGENIDRRVEWGERLFGRTLKKLDKRYHGLNTKQIAYDIFGFPHESLHTAGEVLRWFDETGVTYKGSFAPLRIRDYFYAFSLPEYRAFRSTFSGFPVMQWVGDRMAAISGGKGSEDAPKSAFGRPGPLSRGMSQMAWIPFGLRFNCFTISGTKNE
jgi:ubiquinone/menaquinone biosynthesis C-methylase UbiE